LSEMNKCRHCGSFVPIEKAFCPNCSEPIEPEEAPHRAATTSSDMLSTMRDDPEHYKDLLQELKKKKSPTPPTSTVVEAQPTEADRAGSAPAPPEPTQNAGYSVPQMAAPVPPVKGRGGNLFVMIAIFAVLILLFILLMVFRVF